MILKSRRFSSITVEWRICVVLLIVPLFSENEKLSFLPLSELNALFLILKRDMKRMNEEDLAFVVGHSALFPAGTSSCG